MNISQVAETLQHGTGAADYFRFYILNLTFKKRNTVLETIIKLSFLLYLVILFF